MSGAEVGASGRPGPQYGPITTKQVVDAIRIAFRRGYSDVVFAGFSFDAGAYAEVDNQANPKIKLHLATIRPDVNPGMEGLLKEQPGSQLFTVANLRPLRDYLDRLRIEDLILTEGQLR